LLASMRTPIDSKINLLVGAEGVHLTQELMSETQTSVQHFERRFSTFIATDPRAVDYNTREARPLAAAFGRFQERQARATQAPEAEGEQQKADGEFEVDQGNGEINQWNTRVCNALVAATGLELPAKPEPWWQWWRDYNQMSESSKSQEYGYSYTYETTYIP